MQSPALAASMSIMAPRNPLLRENPDRLVQLDEHIASLKATLEYLEDERRRLTSIPSSAHPIGVPEVLGHIMEWGVHLDCFAPESLLLVSRHWQNVALATPGVWARIVRKPTYMDNFTQFLARCTTYLERSKNHPLYIDVDFLYFYFEAPTAAVYSQFAQIIQPHLHRCYHISLANQRDSLVHLFSSLSPDYIEHIAHYCANATHRGPDLALPPVLPRLRHLSGTFPLPVFANIEMPVLEHLQIALSPVHPSFHDLLSILQRCPNLKFLLFDNVSFTLAVEPDLTSVMVTLEHLTRLEFHRSGNGDATLLTSHCHMPNLRELCITGHMISIPLNLFSNITTLQCNDWEFPWFIRALRSAKNLECLTVRSHGTESPFHTELLAALSTPTSTSSASLTNVPSSSGTGYLIPKLRTLHLTSFTYNNSDFPVDAFLTFLRKRNSSPNTATIEKLVLEDVSHISDFHEEQLKSAVETLNILRTPTIGTGAAVTLGMGLGGAEGAWGVEPQRVPISFPFFPGPVPGAGPVGGRPESPAAAMHPIILPPVAYGAPILPPPTVDGHHHHGDPAAAAAALLANAMIEVDPGRSRSPQRRVWGNNARSRSRSRSPSPVIITEPMQRHRSRRHGRTEEEPAPIIIRTGRSRERERRYQRSISRSPSIEDYVRRRPSSPSSLSRSRSRSSSSGTRSPSPLGRTTLGVHSARNVWPGSSSGNGRRGSPVAATLVLESGQSRSSGSAMHRPRIELDTIDGSSATGDRLEVVFPEHEATRESNIIVRSPSSDFSISPLGGRRLTIDNGRGESVRRRSLLPSMESSHSSSTANSLAPSETARTRNGSPYPYGHIEVDSDAPEPISYAPNENTNVSPLEFEPFGRRTDSPSSRPPSVPSPLRRLLPRQIHTTLSTSTDSTLPMSRERTAAAVQAGNQMTRFDGQVSMGTDDSGAVRALEHEHRRHVSIGLDSLAIPSHRHRAFAHSPLVQHPDMNGSYSFQSKPVRRRTVGGYGDELHFVPVPGTLDLADDVQPLSAGAAALPIRRAHGPHHGSLNGFINPFHPQNPQLVHEPQELLHRHHAAGYGSMPSNDIEHDWTTCLPIGSTSTPMRRHSEFAPKSSDSPKRRGSLWARLKNLVK